MTNDGITLVGLTPLLPWNVDLQRCYVGSNLDYAGYMRSLRDLDIAVASETRRLERILSLCVEAETAEALEELEGLNTAGWPADRVLVGHRLRGVLLRELGDTARSVAAYQDAYNATAQLEAETCERARLVLEWDLLQFEEDLEKGVERQRLLRERPGWPHVPAFDHAAKYSAGEFAKEAFAEAFRSEGGFRVRGGMPPELAWHNAALALAYLVGDHDSAKRERVAFALRICTTESWSSRPENLAIAGRELIAAREDKRLQQLLSRSAHLLHSHLDIDTVLARLHPREPSGSAAEPIWRTRLAVIEGLAKYLSDRQRAELSRQMLGWVEEALVGGGHGAVASRSRHRSVLAATFASIIDLSAEDTLRLVTLLTQHELEVSDRTLWAVLEGVEWTPELQVAASHAVTRLVSKQPHEFEAPLVASLLSRIGVVSEALTEMADRAALAWDTRDDKRIWRAFLDGRSHPLAKPHASRWARALVERIEAAFMEAGPGKGWSSADRDDPYLLRALWTAYPHSEAPLDRAQAVERLLSASANPLIPSDFKVALFDAVAKMVREGVVPRELVALALVNRDPVAEESSDSPLETYGKLAPQLRLVSARVRAGIAPADRDLGIVGRGFIGDSPATRRSAANSASALLEEGHWPGEVASLLFSALADGSPRVRAAAGVALVWGDASLPEAMRKAVFSQLLIMAMNDHPYVRASLFNAWAEPEVLVPAEREGDIGAAALANREDTHADVRKFARKAQVRTGWM